MAVVLSVIIYYLFLTLSVAEAPWCGVLPQICITPIRSQVKQTHLNKENAKRLSKSIHVYYLNISLSSVKLTSQSNCYTQMVCARLQMSPPLDEKSFARS